MRGITDSHSFCNQVKRLSEEWYQPRAKILRSKVVDNSNFSSESSFFDMRKITLKDFIRLSIVSWYTDEEVKFVIQADLHEALSNFSLEDRTLLEQFLFSEAEMLIFLMETNLWHTREFFGNVLTQDLELEKNLKVRFQLSKVKKPQRKRGYHDHGSRILSHRWLPKTDYTLTELQNELEQNIRTQEDTTNLIRGFLN